MKTVLNTSEVAHYFANQLQDNARNANNSFYFNRDYKGVLTIYSYGSHFPIARFSKDSQGNEVLFFTLRNYSNTTAKHINKVYSATNHIKKVYCYLQSWDSDTIEASFKAWENNINQNLKSLATARKPERYIFKIQRELEQVNEFCKTLNIEPTIELKELINSIDNNTFNDILTSKAEIIAKENKEKKEKKEKEAKEVLIELDKFRAFEPCEIYKIRKTNFDYLRYNKEANIIETTQNVKIEYKEAQNLYRYITHLLPTLAKNEKKIIQGVNISHYRVNSISNKEVKIGCHTITIKEIINFANQLGW